LDSIGGSRERSFQFFLHFRPDRRRSDKQTILTGLLVTKDANEVVLKDAQDKVIRIPSKQIEQLVPQRQSLMPDLLLRDMTAQQVADLLAYLGSLK
jgi:hypothetical protein